MPTKLEVLAEGLRNEPQFKNVRHRKREGAVRFTIRSLPFELGKMKTYGGNYETRYEVYRGHNKIYLRRIYNGKLGPDLKIWSYKSFKVSEFIKYMKRGD